MSLTWRNTPYNLFPSSPLSQSFLLLGNTTLRLFCITFKDLIISALPIITHSSSLHFAFFLYESFLSLTFSLYINLFCHLHLMCTLNSLSFVLCQEHLHLSSRSSWNSLVTSFASEHRLLHGFFPLFPFTLYMSCFNSLSSAFDC